MKKNIRCLIVDDEKYARMVVESYIRKIPYLQLVGQCKDPFEAISFLQENKVDLIFLDIQMPELNGIELLKSLNPKPLVIITSAYDQYAMEGYDLDVVDYLLKPFGFDRFIKSVIRASKRIQSFPFSSNSAPLKNSIQQTDFSKGTSMKDYLLVKSEHKVHKIWYDQIFYIKGMKEYVAFHLESGRILSLQSLKALEECLPANQFIRIHKSYIISIKKANTLEGNQLYIKKEKIPIGVSYKEKVLARIF